VNGPIRLAVPLAAALAIAACNSGGSSNMPTTGSSGQTAAHSRFVPDWQAKRLAHPACGAPRQGEATCLALNIDVKTPPLDHRGQPQAKQNVSGLWPIDLETRYNLPITQGSGQIVAIVDAYDNPNVASDLSTYRSNFGLGTANFFKYNQNGQQSNYPQGSTGWGVEIDLDVDMVSAACPLCTIYLIEANGADVTDLETAEATAVSLGAHIISNSWICYDSNSCVSQSYFDTPGVVYLAASGDAGYNNNGAPEALNTVVSVGGTNLSKNGSTYTEVAWNGAGSGCATGVTKPSWQHDTGCTYRTTSDISSEAGCSPGVAEYDTYGAGGWITECGTSAASPLIGGVYALAGNASSQNAAQNLWKLKKKKRKKELYDITTGSNGSCGGSYLCTAIKGYDGPTGWGTPKGVKAF
jgi:subtilase family serine protease